MKNIYIQRPVPGQINELHQFFIRVITDTFTKEGLGGKKEDIEEEIASKFKVLQCDFDTRGDERFFLTAAENGKIIGTIEFGPASELICACTNGSIKDLMEVGTVFVDPDYQQKGIGSRMLQAVFAELKNRGFEEFCMDSGYSRAQAIWRKRFGEPEYCLRNYWGEGLDHMIWRLKVRDVLKS
ncbi:GNAT family N-acetyltransferase [Bacillus sp. FJAT-42376]|uniref:GNAT family N-acetyltransferase n=1 Tax=Bacillus sp. FJAT-42376 TaxID=2014076 RepID=UPI000F4EDD46|nr:GNAT family N-acetyltransferase [Bacillus sp. FJAT-42376]AZB41851.1 GNAT family N-acetyltransferase [Bacillus sp. FJAT-42376]